MDASLAFYCLQEYGWRPSETLALPREEKAFVLAVASEHAKATRKKMNDAERKAKRKR